MIPPSSHSAEQPPSTASEETSVTVGQALVTFLRACGYSLAAISERTERSLSTIGNWQSGNLKPDFDDAHKIAAAFDVRIEVVFQPNGLATMTFTAPGDAGEWPRCITYAIRPRDEIEPVVKDILICHELADLPNEFTEFLDASSSTPVHVVTTNMAAFSFQLRKTKDNLVLTCHPSLKKLLPETCSAIHLQVLRIRPVTDTENSFPVCTIQRTGIPPLHLIGLDVTTGNGKALSVSELRTLWDHLKEDMSF